MPPPRMLTHNGITQSMTAWAKSVGLNRATIERRINRDGASVSDALTRPLNTTKTGSKYGDGCLRSDGYRTVSVSGALVMEHVIVVEKAIGRKLRGTEEVHHVNGIRSDNRPENLVLCPDRKYHEMLHMRQDALNKAGNANFRACKFCKQLDDPAVMYAANGRAGHYHRECGNAYQRKRRSK